MTDLRKKIGFVLPVLGLLGALLSAPRTACANSGNTFLETIGTSTAVGTVLGASTLPFYTNPGDNLINLAYGATAGAAVGLGVWIYGLLAGSPQNGSEAAHKLERPSFDSAYARLGDERPFRVTTRFSTARSPLVWMPLVSVNW